MNSKYILMFIVFLSVFSFSMASQARNWKSIFIAGDDSIGNFDNGREDLTKMFSNLGQMESFQLSSSRNYISESKQVYSATEKNIESLFNQLNVKDEEGCFVHMTSHGAKGQGFYLALSGILTPDNFAVMVNEACGDVPTVILVSACYSGQFITESLKGLNRVILTAARADRPSFGCSADTEYTYWDACLLDEAPRSGTWAELYANVNTCIANKEAKLNVRPSEPQAYFGEATKSWPILR